MSGGGSPRGLEGIDCVANVGTGGDAGDAL